MLLDYQLLHMCRRSHHDGLRAAAGCCLTATAMLLPAAFHLPATACSNTTLCLPPLMPRQLPRHRARSRRTILAVVPHGA
ncbi:hypothetical protein AQ611_06090 [Burkholderia singularis]|nr:hypothetical protein AQ611_06090 [Burkholderia sp. Bp7605]